MSIMWSSWLSGTDKETKVQRAHTALGQEPGFEPRPLQHRACAWWRTITNNLPHAKLQAVNLKETQWHWRYFIYLKLGNMFHMVKGWKGLLWKPARPSGKGRRVLLSPTSAVCWHTSGLWGGADPREHRLSRGVITWWCRRQAVPPLHLCSSFLSQTWKSYRLLLSREQSPCSWAAASHANTHFLPWQLQYNDRYRSKEKWYKDSWKQTRRAVLSKTVSQYW